MADSLGSGFDAPSVEEWLARAVKAAKLDPETTELVGELGDGTRVNWLYTQADELGGDPSGEPGVAPFTRGRGARRWDIRQSQRHPDRARARGEILEDLEGGVTSVLMRFDDVARAAVPREAPEFTGARGRGGVIVNSLAELDEVTDGMYLDMAGVALDAGASSRPAAALLCALWKTREIAAESRIGSFGLDPVGTLAREGVLNGSPDHELEAAVEIAGFAHRSMPGVRTLAVDSEIYAAAGATAAQELAISLATGVEFLRAAAARGVEPSVVSSQLEITFSVGPEQFLEIAKFRAARRTWARVLEGCGVAAAERWSRTYAKTTGRAFAAVDPWVNMLRATTAGFAAAAGGVDGMTIDPFDSLLGHSSELGRRISRNTQLILMEESALGKLADPAGGSWYVESLTDQLARESWQIFQSIEQRGGALAAFRDGFIAAEVGRSADERASNTSTRKQLLTGVNIFPMLADDGVTLDEVDVAALAKLDAAKHAEAFAGPRTFELGDGEWLEAATAAAIEGATIDDLGALSPTTRSFAIPLEATRDSEPFETLRSAAAELGGAEIFLACIGPVAQHVSSATWAKSFFESGGIAAVSSTEHEDATALGKELAESGTRLAAICSGGETDESAIQPIVDALRNAGAERVYLANGSDQDSVLIGTDRAVRDGVDMVDELGGALAVIGER